MEKDKGASINLQLHLERITCAKMQLDLLQREDSESPEIESSCHRYQRMEAIIEAEKALSFSQCPADTYVISGVCGPVLAPH